MLKHFGRSLTKHDIGMIKSVGNFILILCTMFDPFYQIFKLTVTIIRDMLIIGDLTGYILRPFARSETNFYPYRKIGRCPWISNCISVVLTLVFFFFFFFVLFCFCFVFFFVFFFSVFYWPFQGGSYDSVYTSRKHTCIILTPPPP